MSRSHFSFVKPLILLAGLFVLLGIAACTREVIKEVPVEVPVEVTVAPTTAPEPPSDESSGPQVYQLGIFEDLTTTNYWSFLGPDTTIWNSYVLSGGKPSLYGPFRPTLRLGARGSVGLPHAAGRGDGGRKKPCGPHRSK